MKFNRKSIRVITAPTQPLVTVEEMKSQLKIDGDEDDCLLELYIASAIDAAQKYCGISFITQTIEFTLDGFSESNDDVLAALGPGVFDIPKSYFFGGSSAEFDLPYGPLQSVTSIKTRDLNNTETTVDPALYSIDIASGRVFLNYGEIWPVNLRDRAAVKVLFIAGYGTDPAQVPPALRQGVMQHVQQMYECRGVCECSDACKCIFDGYKRIDNLGFY